MATMRDRLSGAVAFVAAGLVLAAGAGCSVIRQHQATLHAERGDAALAEDDLEAALIDFEAAARFDPQMAVAHSKLGVIYQRMGEYERAIDAFASAVRCSPFSYPDTMSLARLYHFTKRLRDAVEAYLHAADLAPNDFDAQLNLGVCYQEMGEPQRAVERFQRAIEIDPDGPHAYVNLGVAFDTQGKHYEAIAAYKDALERDNHQPLVLVNLAKTYMEQDRLKLARMTLEMAVKLDDRLAPAHEALGYCLFRMQEYEEAEQSYRNALLYDPKLPRTYAGLGSLYALRYLEDKQQPDLLDRAMECWHRSLELDPNQPRIHSLVAKYKPRGADPQTILLSDQPPER